MRHILAFLILSVLAVAAAHAQGPAGEWDFGSRADPIRDRTGGGSDLRAEGCEWVAAKRGLALRVPAGSGRIRCENPGAPLRPRDALTIVAWVRPVERAPYRWILDHGRGWGDDNAGYRFGLHQSRLRFMVKADRIVNLSGGDVLDGQWHQVAATYDGKEVRLFQNGACVATHALTGGIDYQGVEAKFQVGFCENGGLGGDIARLKLFGRALAEAEVAADWDAGKGIRLSPEELTAERYEAQGKCALAGVPSAPFARDRHTTLLAHLDGRRDCDATYSRWEGRAGGGEMKRGVPGRFGSAVELLGRGAPILYRGGPNCSPRAGTCEFWIRAPRGSDPQADDTDRYLLTILPEWHVGYAKRPGLHLVLRQHAATRSLQLAANTHEIPWYSHLNGSYISETAGTVLVLPLDRLGGRGWHHVLCSWSLEGEGRVWLLVDGQGVTGKLAPAPQPGPPIPCYKVFLGGSYFPEVFCPSARALFDEFRLSEASVEVRLTGRSEAPPAVRVDEKALMRAEDLCRHFLDFTLGLQMGGGWECVYTWPNLMPDESPGSYAALAEDEYTLRHIVPAYLRAYEILGDDRYLRVAENCGQLLVKTQDEHGAWCQGYMVMPDGFHPVAPGSGSIEEGTQTDPLRVLFWLWRVTGRSEYLSAARRSAEFILAAQKPSGAWPLTFSSQAMRPGGGYTGLSTLNDGTTLWGMKAMLIGWHLTGERKYLDALLRASQWVIGAQLPGVTGAWAEQYGDDGKPAWARDFEPPTACLSAVTCAADALTLMYDLTGDGQYLAPLRRCVEWGKAVPEKHRTYLYYDPETGGAVAAKGHRIFHLGDPGFEEAARYRTQPTYFPRLEARLSARADGPLVPVAGGAVPRRASGVPAVTREMAAGQLDARRAAVDKPLLVLDAFRRGEPAGGLLAMSPRHGLAFFPGRGVPDVQAALDYVLYARVAGGDLDPRSIPVFDEGFFGHAGPARDWYQTPLMGAPVR